MTTVRSEARRRGLRMAAQVAAISGVVAAALAAAQTEASATPSGALTTPGASAEGDRAASPEAAEDGIAGLLRVSSKGNCGCVPCWGPPAPPPMRAELLALFDEVA